MKVRSWIGLFGIIVVLVGTFLLAQNKTIREQVLGLQTSSSIKTNVSAPTSTSSLPANYFGYDIQETPGSDWNYIAGDNMAKLFPGNVRYIGSIVNLWNWRTGDLFPNYQHYVNVRGSDNLDDLKNLIIKVKQEDNIDLVPIFVLNIETAGYTAGDPNKETIRINDQIAMLEQANTLGIPVEQIELGNETYSYPQSNDPFRQYNQKVFPTGKAYGQSMTRWITAIRKVFPNVKIAVSGFTSYETGSIGGNNCYNLDDQNERLQCWNKGLRTFVRGADQIVLHNYPPSELQGSSKSGQNADLKTVDGATNFFGSVYHYYHLLSDVFHTDFQTQLCDTSCPSYNQVLVTEYNLSDYDIQAAVGTWGHGLFTAIQSLGFLDNNAIKKVDHFTFWADANFGAMFNNAYDFVNPPGEALPHSLSASGLTESQINQAAAYATTFQKLIFSNNPIKHPSNSSLPSYSSLVGYRFLGSSHDQSIIINLSNNPAVVNFTNSLAQYNTYEQYAGIINQHFYGDPTKLSVSITNRHFSGQLVLPAYSITRLFKSSFTINSTPTPGAGSCTTSNGIAVSNGQQCPGTNSLCWNGACTGGCHHNPSGCLGGASQCLSSGACAQNIPVPTVTPSQCIQRPACLDAKPFPCMIAEPVNGWCTPITHSTIPSSGGGVLSK